MNQVNFAISILIFIGTLFLVIRKPKGIPIGYSAMIGAVATALFGFTTFIDLMNVINIVWNATLTFISVVIMALVFDEAGVFEYLASRLMSHARGSGRRLYLFVIIIGSFISAIFANDGTAIVLTPIMVALLYRAGLEKKAIIAYVMVVGFIADSASLPLLVSNLVNIIAATYFGISFFPYMELMILPDLASIGSSLLFLYLYFRKSIPDTIPVDISYSKDEIKDPFLFEIFFPTIVILILLYSIGGFYSIPVSIVSMPTAAVLIILSKRGGRIDYIKPVKDAPWQIILFSLGMYIVVYALANNGLVQITAYSVLTFTKMPPILTYILTGYLFAFTASIMNNLPSVLLGDLTLASVHAPRLLLLTNAIGNDIGPKFTTIGSLATLVWLYMLEKKSNLKIRSIEYMKVGISVGLPVLTIALLTLWLESLLI